MSSIDTNTTEKKYPARGFIPTRIAKHWRNRSYTIGKVAGLEFGVNTYPIEGCTLVEMTYLADVESLNSPLVHRERYCFYRWSGTAQELKENAEKAKGNEIVFLADERFEALEIGYDPTK